MFNVCPNCGTYAEAREVTDAPEPGMGIALCASCGASIPFKRRPLFVVTGASGAGKSSTCRELMRRDTGCLALESDILWGAIDVSGDGGPDLYWNTWMKMIKNIHQGDRSVILCGTLVPERLEHQPERRYVGETHYLALVADPAEQASRLHARPAWRESDDPEFIAEHIRFNRWLIDHAGAGDPGWSLLDTTGISVAESADAVIDWIAGRQP